MRHDLAARFSNQLYRAFKNLGADIDLLSVIGSYADTLDDDTVLELLTSYNDDGHSLQGERLVTDRDIAAIANGTYKAPPLLKIVRTSDEAEDAARAALKHQQKETP